MLKERGEFFLMNLLLFDLFLCLLYYFWGHNLIEAMYKGKSFYFLNSVIEGQATHSLNYYFQFADRLILHFLIASNLMAVAGIGLFLFLGWKKLVYLTTVIVISLLTLEILLRFLEPLILKNSIYYNDEGLGIRIQPFKNGANSLGFNDRDYPLTKGAGVIRIVGLGDSFNWAGSYENNYWTLAEKLLGAKMRTPKIEVLNQGTPCVGPAYLFRLLRNVSMAFEPDRVVLAFFVGNDFWESNKEARPIARLGYPLSIQPGVHFLDLDRDVYSYFLLKTSLTLGIDFYFKAKERSTGQRVGSFSKRGFLRIEEERMPVCLKNFYRSQSWRETQQRILDFKNYLRNKKVGFYVIILPDQYQVDEALRKEVFGAFPLLVKSNYDFELPQRKLKRFLEDHKIEYVDLLPFFRKVSKNGDLYQLRETHFNRDGNLLAAQVVAEFLEEKLRE